ncbi:MAG: 3-isopropylmalate dehydratase [Candidatus Omnitrophica bacterium]|nr:3-isopropylmalate dehydratase [Candidatus Omnitrophota bacterium]
MDIISGKAYVVKDDIDTDVIIPAHYLALSHTVPAQRDELASHAFEGLPDDKYPVRFIKPGQTKSEYAIVVAGDNFGCGSSRAQAPGAMMCAGVAAVVASFYARIFFRNAVNAGLLLPLESMQRLCDEIRTGDELEIQVKERTLLNKTRKNNYTLKPVGTVADILAAGDVFAYAKQLLAKGELKGPVKANHNTGNWVEAD